MSHWLDLGGVALALLVSAFYASTALGPKRWRARVWGALASSAERMPAPLRKAWLIERLARRASRAEAACGGCSGCGTSKPSNVTSAPGRAEVRIPLERLTRR